MPAVRFELRSSTKPISVDDYRIHARRAVPKMVWSYIDGAADDLVSLKANRSAFRRWNLLPRVLAGIPAPDLGTEIAGVPLSLPVLLAPTGLSGLAHWTGDMGGAQAAERAGTRSIISTAASYSPEEIAAATRQHHFFQLYPWTDSTTDAQALTRSFIARARDAGFTALFVTVDTAAKGNREAELRNGMDAPPTLTPWRVADAAIRPRWCYNFLRHQRSSAAMLLDRRGMAAGVQSARIQYRMMRPELSWDDFAWMRDQWQGPVFIKGVLNPDDAEKAVSLGADGVVVSNHGGRQLDGVQAAVDALPAVADRVGGTVPVLMDGGIRRGTDVVTALCLGASAVLIGRPWLYGLAAGGPAGAEHVIEILREEIGRAMTLMGVGSVAELDRSKLIRQGGSA